MVIQNEKIQRTIVFGGYHPTLPTHVLTSNREVQFNYSYFADTFLYEMTAASPAESVTANSQPNASTLPAPKWQQVLTPGFPTYRCQAQLVCDAETGRTYMFGGWTNNQYIPTRTKMHSRSFGDLWELRVDLPGGHFAEVNMEEEARVARAGPWQRCFACAAAGPWKKCGGALPTPLRIYSDLDTMAFQGHAKGAFSSVARSAFGRGGRSTGSFISVAKRNAHILPVLK